MGKRTRIRKQYLQRDKLGRFKKWTNIGRSIKADSRQQAQNTPSKPGYGHQGDYNKQGIKKMVVKKIPQPKKISKPQKVKKSKKLNTKPLL